MADAACRNSLSTLSFGLFWLPVNLTVMTRGKA